MSINETLSLLHRLTPLRTEKRQQRNRALLAAPGLSPSKTERPESWPTWCAGWAFTIQPTLATALDIQLTTRITNKVPNLEWTQGSAFDFREGYTIHDAPEAWTMPWGEALKHIKYSLKIVDAIPASPANATSDEARFSGEVTFQIYRPNATCSALERHGEPRTVSQDDFVRILIVGLPEKWTQEQLDSVETTQPDKTGPQILQTPFAASKTYDIEAVDFYTRPFPQVHVVGAYFAFTGKFKYGFQEDVIRATEAAGGSYLRGIADYLVVGERLSKKQDLPLLSNQVKDALMYRKIYGANMAIVPESAWLAGLQNPTPLPDSAKKHYPHNTDEEKCFWEGEKYIQLQYQKYDSPRVYNHQLKLSTLSFRMENRAIYFWTHKKNGDLVVIRTSNICSDILNLETGESFSVNDFLQHLIGHDLGIKPYTWKESGEFVPLVEIGIDGIKEV